MNKIWLVLKNEFIFDGQPALVYPHPAAGAGGLVGGSCWRFLTG